MRWIVNTVIAGTLIGAVAGFASWTVAMGGGIDQFGTTLLSAGGGAILGLVMGGIAYAIDRIRP